MGKPTEAELEKEKEQQHIGRAPTSDLTEEEISKYLHPKEGGDITQPIRLNDGTTVDGNNLPGKKRLELINSGLLSVEKAMPIPANMPGKKLKQIKERQQGRLEEMIKAQKKAAAKANKSKAGGKTKEGDEPKEGFEEGHVFQVGDSVEYKGNIVEILEIEADSKGNQIKLIFNKPETGAPIKVPTKNVYSVESTDIAPGDEDIDETNENEDQEGSED